jgi:hypothetical protein
MVRRSVGTVPSKAFYQTSRIFARSFAIYLYSCTSIMHGLVIVINNFVIVPFQRYICNRLPFRCVKKYWMSLLEMAGWGINLRRCPLFSEMTVQSHQFGPVKTSILFWVIYFTKPKTGHTNCHTFSPSDYYHVRVRKVDHRYRKLTYIYIYIPVYIL